MGHRMCTGRREKQWGMEKKKWHRQWQTKRRERQQEAGKMQTLEGKRKETQKMDVYQMCLQDTVRRNQLIYCTSLKQSDNLCTLSILCELTLLNKSCIYIMNVILQSLTIFFSLPHILSVVDKMSHNSCSSFVIKYRQQWICQET